MIKTTIYFLVFSAGFLLAWLVPIFSSGPIVTTSEAASSKEYQQCLVETPGKFFDSSHHPGYFDGIQVAEFCVVHTWKIKIIY